MVGTFWGKKSLKALSNKVFRFIQQALLKIAHFPTFPRKGRKVDKLKDRHANDCEQGLPSADNSHFLSPETYKTDSNDR